MKKFLSRMYLAAAVPTALNIVYFIAAGSRYLEESGISGLWKGLLLAAAIVGLSVTYLYLIFFPAHDRVKTSLRTRIMLGGQGAVYCGLYGMAAQAAVFWIFYVRNAGPYNLGIGVMAANAVCAVTGSFLLLASGVLRIFFTSRRLSVVRRIVMLLTMWIPLVNLAVLLYACRLVYEEYDFERERARLRMLRVDSQICRTKYPLLLVHGIGFRDLRYFNYWGRIPRELMRNGATVYYGSQEAFGTIAYNAEDIRKRIFEICEEIGVEKVNIIAHSKGGLDARYVVSKLGMAPYVASLTTMCTPHRGCRFVDYACRLPEGLYRLIANCFDKTFAKLGDKNPDFYTATHQFATKASEQFNAEVPDAPGVYYQSYASKMSRPWSHWLLSVPYCMIRPLEGANDGLVSVESAKWGEFQGVFANSRTRGISHGDMIDLKREDYKGFDVVETYVQIVAKLKEKGY